MKSEIKNIYAIANSPFFLDNENALTVLTGDILRINEWCKNGYVHATCVSTMCSGICPSNILKKITNYQNTEKISLLLQLEYQKLLEYIFFEYFPLQKTSPNDMYILKYIKELQKLLNSNVIILEDIPKLIDSLRQKLGFEPIQRINSKEILRINDLDISIFDKNIIKRTKNSSLHSNVLKISVSFSIYSKEKLRLTTLVSTSDNMRILSAPNEILINKNSTKQVDLKFYNIEEDNLESVLFIVRAYSILNINKEKTVYEFKGVYCKKINLSSSNDKFEDILRPYSTHEGSPGLVSLICSKPKDTHFVEDMKSIKCFFSFSKNKNLIFSGSNSNHVFSLKYPSNFNHNYSINSLYIILENLKSNKKLSKVIINIRLLNIEKKRFVSCMKNSNDQRKFQSSLVQRASQYSFDEIAEIDLNYDNDYSNYYFIFEICSATGNNVNYFSVLPLITKDKCIFKQKSYELKFRKLISSDRLNESKYVELINKNYIETKEVKTSVQISLILLSNKQTSNPCVSRILNWKEFVNVLEDSNETSYDIEPEILSMFLDRLLFSLVEMCLENNAKLRKFAINFIITILLQIDQNRFKFLETYYDAFLQTKFTPENEILTNLYNIFVDYISDFFPDENTQYDQRCKTHCRCLCEMLSLISASLKLAKELNKPINEKEFKQSINKLLYRLNFLMRQELNPEIEILKSIICRSFPKLCDIIFLYYDFESSFKIIKKFFKSVATKNLKLRLITHFIECNFFQDPRNQDLILDIIINHLLVCCDDNSNFQNEIFPIIRTIFFKLYGKSPYFQKLLYKLTIFLPNIVKSKENEYFTIVFLYFLNSSNLKNFILENQRETGIYEKLIFLSFRVVKSNPPSYILFPAATAFTKLIVFSQLKEFSFVETIINQLIECISGFYTVYFKVYESFPLPDQKLYNQIYHTSLSSLRNSLPKLIKSVSEGTKFFPNTILPLFHFYYRQNNPQTREQISDCFKMIILSDYRSMKNLVRTENSCIFAIESISNVENDNLPILNDLFIETKNKFIKDENTYYNDIIMNFFDSLNNLAKYFYDLNNLPNQYIYEDERVTAIMSIIESCEKKKDHQMVYHFASILYEFHIMCDNKVEAAETLVLCSKELSWNDSMIISEGYGFPTQEKSERKLTILKKAVSLFMETQFYERALDIIQEIKKYMIELNCEYESLSSLFELEKECYQLICSSERISLNRFYGVHFYGDKFDLYFRNKNFVYRKNGFYMSDQLIRDLKNKFPDAEISSNKPSLKQIKDPNLYYIHIFNLKPDDKSTFNPYLLQSQRMVSKVCNVTRFYSEVPIRIKNSNDYGEFAEWHRFVHYYEIDSPLQGISRRQPIISVSSMKMLSPIECAILDTNSKTLELMENASSYWRCIEFNIDFKRSTVSSFSMLINGIVNAGVNGGTKVFLELFFESDFKDEEVNQTFSSQLKDSFEDQLKAVNFAIKVHSIVMDKEYTKLHENIIENFYKMKDEFEKVIGEIDVELQPKLFSIPDTNVLDDLLQNKS